MIEKNISSSVFIPKNKHKTSFPTRYNIITWGYSTAHCIVSKTWWNLSRSEHMHSVKQYEHYWLHYPTYPYKTHLNRKNEITVKKEQGQKMKADLAVLLLDLLQILRLLLFAHIGLVHSQVVTSAQLGQQHTWVTPSQLQGRQISRLTICYQVSAVKWPHVLTCDLFLFPVHGFGQQALTLVIPLFLIFIALITNAWRCGNMRQCLDSASKTHLVGDVEAFVWVAECERLFQSLFPGHASVHTDLQGTTKCPHQRWDN